MADNEQTRAMNAADPRWNTVRSASSTETSEAIEAAFTPEHPQGDPLADPAKRRKVELELQKLGLSPEEVRRLVTARANTTEDLPMMPAAPNTPRAGMSAGAVAPQPANKVAAKKPRLNEASLQSFAAELMANRSIATNRAVEEAAHHFPGFRECSASERQISSGLLREAHMLRRKEKYREAEEKCRQAILQTPKDAPALEMLGDILQGVAQVDEALAAYKRAMEADPKRSSCEKKYGDLLMRQQNWGGFDGEAVTKNPWVAVFFSAALPGAGQLHNGEIAKGLLYVGLDALAIWLLAWSPWGFIGEHGRHGINVGLLGCAVFASVVYITAMIDANAVARHGRKPGRGSL